jgi:murein DD-endopeptidase MepM/ murein hydrolase activator NlpD
MSAAAMFATPALRAVLLALLRCSLAGAGAALVCLAATALLRRMHAPCALRWALWLVVAVRLLCPAALLPTVSVPVPAWAASQISASQLSWLWDTSLDTPALAADAAQSELAAQPDVTDRNNQAERAAGDAASAAQTEQAASPDIADITGQPERATDDAALAESANTVPANGSPDAAPHEQDAAPAAEPSGALSASVPLVPLPALLILLWLGGAVFLLGRAVWHSARLRRSVRTAWRERDEALGLPYYTGSCVSTPFVLGFVRPRIYLPVGLDDAARRHILLHERAHLRHGDHILRPIFYLAVCLHWFNPFAWLAFGCMRRDGESFCDESALHTLGDAQKRSYCESLLRFAAPIHGYVAAFGEGSIKMRIQTILHTRKASPAARIVGAALALAVGFACLTACAPASTSSEAADSTEAAASSAATTAVKTAASAAAVDSSAASGPVTLLWPVPDYTSISQSVSASHTGVDLVAEEGTDILAAADGVVTVAQYRDTDVGLMVEIDHGNGLVTQYMHCASISSLAPGQTVTQGQVIATVGRTGRATGALCHFVVLQDGEYQSITRSADGLYADTAPLAEGSPAEEADTTALLWPVPRFTAISGPCTDEHPGLDLAGNLNSDILAVADGVVTFAGEHGTDGLMVEIDHGNGLVSEYLHCYGLNVETGDTVTQGQLIAGMGNTGLATSSGFSSVPFCHISVSQDGKYLSLARSEDGIYMDTAPLAAEEPDDASADTTALLWPVPDYTSISQSVSASHTGVDLAAEEGVNILAAADGVVTFAGEHGADGLMLEIDHGNGLVTQYQHCSALNVEVGDTVTQGQVIATVGSTGRATGPHCHFAVLQDGTYQSVARSADGLYADTAPLAS